MSSLFYVEIEDKIAMKTSSFPTALAFNYASLFVFSIAYPKRTDSTKDSFKRKIIY